MVTKKSSDKNFQYLSLLISLLAFMISAGSLYFSYFVYSQSHKEEIVINAVPLSDDYVTHIEPGLGVLTVQWVLVLSNNGEKSSSVIQYNIDKYDRKSRPSWYSGMDQGIFDENDVRLSLPLDIESGKSKKIILKVGVLLDGKIVQILKKTHFPKGNVAISAVKDSLYKDSLDLFGNRVDPKFYKNKLITVAWPGEHNQDIFNLSLTTAKQGNFTTILRVYPF